MLSGDDAGQENETIMKTYYRAALLAAALGAVSLPALAQSALTPATQNATQTTPQTAMPDATQPATAPDATQNPAADTMAPAKSKAVHTHHRKTTHHAKAVKKTPDAAKTDAPSPAK